ncbi:MAG TPA: T9SS type A sorting domain-containing protein [Bacteroidia bacterium]|jgi:hypothetical protein|nr:T9SS type A sorting domain-containing protein [Bacteroidia bacterium]
MKGKKEITSFFGCIFLALFILYSGFSFSQTTNISTNSSQAAAGTPAAGATSVLLYYFTLNVTVGAPSFTAINNFTTSGSYIAGDLVNLKLWMSNFEFFGGGTLVTITTLAAGLGPGTHTFAFANPLPGTGQKYFWITADFASNAICSDAITCDLITSGMYAITGTKNYGTNDPAGTQTVTGGGCQTLPVELISFTGKNADKENFLAWSTATETNNNYFTLEQSLDAVLFKEIKRVPGGGNTLEIKNYKAIDTAPYEGISYYRLKQTDYNGKFTYSSIIAVEGNGNPAVGKPYPNPNTGKFNFNVFSAANDKIHISLFNIYGGLVYEEIKELKEGNNHVEMNADFLITGSYFLKTVIEGNNSVTINKVVRY